MTLADIEEGAHVEGQVPEEVAPQDCNILEDSDANRQRALADSLKQSAIENSEPGLTDTHGTRGNEVG